MDAAYPTDEPIALGKTDVNPVMHPVTRVLSFSAGWLGSAVMNWSMPRPVRQGVAVLLATAWAASLIWGVVTAPSRGRLPGQAPVGASGQPLQAQDATPLSEERIEGAPEPVILSEAEKAALEAEKKAKAEAAQLARAEAEKGAPAGPEAIVAAAPPVVAEKALAPDAPPPPKPEEPLF